MEANELLRVQHEVTSERDPEKRGAARVIVVRGLVASQGERACTLKTLGR